MPDIRLNHFLILSTVFQYQNSIGYKIDTIQCVQQLGVDNNMST